YFEGLIRKYLLEPEHASLFIMKPEAGLTGKREQELKEKLAAYKASLTAEQLAEIKRKQEGLQAYQDEPETKETLEKLPLLQRSDLKKEAMPLIAKKSEWAGIHVVSEEVFTNGIAYLKLNFDVHEVPVAKLPYLGLLVTALGYMDSDHYTQRELDNEVNIETGGIFTGLETFVKYKDANYYRPTCYFTIKVMYDKIGKAFELVEEMMHHTKLDDLTRLKEIILETKSKKQMELNGAGHSVAVRRALSYQSQKSYYADLVEGIAYYRFLADLAEHVDERVAEVATELKQLCAILFRKENLIAGVTAEAEGLAVVEKELAKVAEFIPGTSIAGDIRFRAAEFNFQLEKKQEAFTCSGQVQYVAKCGNFLETGVSYGGALDVANNILSMSYFWDKVRVHGGAYGCMSNFGLDGAYTLVSYRDPNLTETLDIFDHAWEYLRDFDVDEREMTKMIIGTLSNTDAPLTPRSLGARSFNHYMAGTTFEELQKARDERLAATPADIRACAELYHQAIAQDCMCVVGSEAKIEANKELFGSIESLL
ncbi:MAG: insulinase family protein, partial [Lachnospiraceae bacterium]|nr:insulinase family protein [Lachnospiraceae bacterium]